jgi:hypothetical protein
MGWIAGVLNLLMLVENARDPPHHVGEAIEQCLKPQEHSVPLRQDRRLPAEAGSLNGTIRDCP